MASFALDPAAISPSVEIVNRFRDATSIKKATGAKAFCGSLDSPEKDIYRIRGLITKNLALDTQYTHEVFSSIDKQIRPRAWGTFLNVAVEPRNDLYESACREEPKKFDAKIRDDAFRTFKGDSKFWAKVSEESIIRVLNALSVDFGYVQGMNVLLGPFLYIMPEAEAYTCMTALLHDRIPRYVLRNLDGAHDGAKLFARCLRLLDAKLFTHLSSKIPDLSIFSLRYILTLSANSRPLSEVLKLWDAILAVGVHFNILLLCAKLMLMRETLLKEKRGSKIMQMVEDSPTCASQLIDGAFCLIRFIPASLLHELIAHATSKTLPTTPADTPPPSAGNSTNALHASGVETHSNAVGGDTVNGNNTENGNGKGTHPPNLHRAAIAALGGRSSPTDAYTARSDDSHGSQGSSQGESSGSTGDSSSAYAGIKLHSASLESCSDSLEGLGISAALSTSRSIESMVCPGDGSPTRAGVVVQVPFHVVSKDGTD